MNRYASLQKWIKPHKLIHASEAVTKLELGPLFLSVFEQNIGPNIEELEAVRALFERLLRDYNIWYYNRDFLGYYRIDRNKRSISGVYPTTCEELIFCMLYMSILVFSDPRITVFHNWLVESALYAPEIAGFDWNVKVQRVYGRITNELEKRTS